MFLVYHNIEPASIYLDVGQNSGIMTTLLSDAAGNHAEEIAFCCESGQQRLSFAMCRWGVFMLCDRSRGVLANESQAQWYSDRTQGPLGGPYRALEVGEAVSGG